jgi:hypothetical protein
MKNAIGVVLLVIVVYGIYSFFFGERLPVKFYICGKGHVDCELVARFDDMDSCETTNQKWGWYCDQTDKSNIICEERESSFTDGYCTN